MKSFWSRPPATFKVADYSDVGQVRQYTDNFTECYYDLDHAGNVNLVFRRGGTGDFTPGIERGSTQIIHIRGVWHSVAGKNPFHATQINGTVQYAVVGKGMGTTFEGAGAVHFSEDDFSKNSVSGSLDKAILLPKRNLSNAEPLFARAELCGTFTAKRNPREVARIANDLERMFGPRSVDASR